MSHIQNGGGGGSGGMAIGSPVTGGANFGILFVDGSGNLAQSDNATFFLQFDTSGSPFFFVQLATTHNFIDMEPTLFAIGSSGIIEVQPGHGGTEHIFSVNTAGDGNCGVIALKDGGGLPATPTTGMIASLGGVLKYYNGVAWKTVTLT